MTTIVAWVSFQNGKASALTFASDSRLSWDPGKSFWDFGRKIFWCKNSADVFGFAGDMITQSTILSQVCELFDYSLLAKPELHAEERHKYFVRLMRSAVEALNDVFIEGIETLHGMREDQEGGHAFRLWRTKFNPKTLDWADNEMKFSSSGSKSNRNDPGQFFSSGSGAQKHRNHWETRTREAGDTSRAIFRALVDVIEQGDDKQTGGMPQVVSLGSNGFPKPVGVSVSRNRSVCGMPLGPAGGGGVIEWRDENYLFLSPESLERKSNAPKHYFK